MSDFDKVGADNIAHAAIMYGAQIGMDEPRCRGPRCGGTGPGMPWQQEAPYVSRQERDDWWKWAVGGGIVSVLAYRLYLKSQEGR